MERIDIETWERREHFELFQNRERAQIAITAAVDVTRLVESRKQASRKPPLSIAFYHAATSAVNGIDEFRYRIVDREVVQYKTIHSAFTYMPVQRSIHCNCFATYDADFSVFEKNCMAAREKADRKPTLFPAGGEGQDLIYFSVLPGISFTCLTNPWGDPWEDTVPRIIFGKIYEQSGKSMLPMSVEAMHSFVDGVHLSQFFEQVEERLNMAGIMA